MNIPLPEAFVISSFKNKEDVKPVQRALSFEHLVKALQRHMEREEKDGPLFSPASYKPETTRANANVEAVSLALFDFDDGTQWEDLKPKIISRELAYIVYSTFQHTHEAPRFRLVLFPSQPVPGGDWPEVWKRLHHFIGGKNDRAAKDPSRMYYMPSCPPGAERFFEYGEGDALDVNALPPVPEPAKAPLHARPCASLTLSDTEVLSRARQAKNGDKFRRLYEQGDCSGYESRSEAVVGLCCLIGFWTGPDKSRIDCLFRQSALYPPFEEKWDKRHYGDGRTWGEGSIDAALERMTEYYTPTPRITYGRGFGGKNGPSANDNGDERMETEETEEATPCSFPYEVTPEGTFWFKPSKEGPIRVPLSNFAACIKKEVEEDDGVEIRRSYEIEATLRGRSYGFAIPVSQFAAMNWTAEHLGARALVSPGQGLKDHLRFAIQALSVGVEERRVYGHTGWRKVGDDWLYLHADGALGTHGTHPDIQVTLCDALSRFTLPDPPDGGEQLEAIRETLELFDVAEEMVSIPLFGMVFRSVIGKADFGGHLVGPSGVAKSELAALAQQLFGPQLDARHLPGSWSSSENYLEGLAFAAKDSLLVIDDFAPTGTQSDVAALHRKADRVLRAQGNTSGRGRMRPDGSLRPAKPPRGLILSTGEDTPRGQSLRARLFILEVGPDTVRWDRLSQAQKAAAEGRYAQAMAGFIRWLSPRYEEINRGLATERTELRNTLSRDMAGHKRTPGIFADLAIGLRYFIRYAQDSAALSAEEAQSVWERCMDALKQVSEAQSQQQIDHEPTHRFLSLLASALVSGRAHVANPEGGPPHVPQAWGWRCKTVGSGDFAHEEWHPQGDRIGWLEEENLYLEPGAAYTAAQRLAQGGGDALHVTLPTLKKRLDEKRLL
ncbi:MAG: DUF927 domain-containing protein, partial [Armatimonadetes bacterium]|nr:DUF927 domain-containing protein [Armatimonadota bacterium]